MGQCEWPCAASIPNGLVSPLISTLGSHCHLPPTSAPPPILPHPVLPLTSPPPPSAYLAWGLHQETYAAVLMGLPAGRRHLAPRRGLCLGTGGAGLPWASGPAKAAGGGGGPSPGLYCAGLAVQGRAAPLRVAVRLRPPLRGRLRRFSSPTDSAVVRPAHPVSARPCRAAEPRPAETGLITAGRLRRSSALSTMGAAPLLPPTPAGRLSRQCARSPLTTDTTLPWRTRAAQS